MREYNGFCQITRFTLVENQKLEHRSVIKFLVLEGQSPTNIYERLVVVYDAHAPTCTTVFECVRRFKDEQ
jgi:hypothetical protein